MDQYDYFAAAIHNVDTVIKELYIFKHVEAGLSRPILSMRFFLLG